MEASGIPTKFPVPFASGAASGNIRTVPQSPSSQLGAASLSLGFPPACFMPIAAGGSWPFGQDFNGLLNQSTAWNQWAAAGGPIYYDAAFSAAIGGYPMGAFLQSATLGKFWISIVDNNTSDPDTGGAGWAAFPSSSYVTGTLLLNGLVGASQSFSGASVAIGSRGAYLEMVAGGGPGGSGNGGGGGGGAGAAGVRGWFSVVPGAAVSGSAGAGGTTTAGGTGGVPASLSTLTIGTALIATLNPGGGGALGGSAEVAGSTAFGTVASAIAGLMQFNGQSGGNGILAAELLIGGAGGSSMLGAGGLAQFTINTGGAAASGNAPTFYGAGGSGATGSGTVGAPGGPGQISITFFS